MDWINKYLSCTYVDGGRGPVEFDCWGLVRHVRTHELNLSLLPSYGSLRNTNPRDFTNAYRTESSKMEQCAAEHGAIAAVLIGKICSHVAVVLDIDGQLFVLEINPVRGARKLPLRHWLRDHLTVTYHRDRA